jgi:hypothetical protein
MAAIQLREAPKAATNPENIQGSKTSFKSAVNLSKIPVSFNSK